ncbi:hypothetical protein ACGFX8_34395 [Streptomyces sp. NPDC048362]|uniref:hypothetical protein n=1 Tax=Streptomyces sp. NPDC048362 TaxID=3365539 RepID=UPI003714E7C5
MRYLQVNDLLSDALYGTRMWPPPAQDDPFRTQMLQLCTAFPAPIHERIAEVVKSNAAGKIAISAVRTEEMPGGAALNDTGSQYSAFWAPAANSLYVPDVTRYQLSPYRVSSVLTALHEAAHAFENPQWEEVHRYYEYTFSNSESFLSEVSAQWIEATRPVVEYVENNYAHNVDLRKNLETARSYLIQPHELFADGMAQYYCSISKHPTYAALHKAAANANWLGVDIGPDEVRDSTCRARDLVYKWFASYMKQWED